MKKRVRLNGVLAGIGVIIYLILLLVLPRSLSPALSKIVSAIAFTLFLGGQFSRILGRAYKVEHSERGATLVKAGPYALVRNPMYLGSFLMGLAFTFILGNIWVVLAYLVIFFSRFLPQVRLEEKMLLGKFGSAYADYLKAVPRFMPRKLKGFFNGLKSYTHIKRAPWIKKEIWSALAWVILFLLVTLIKDLRQYSLTEYIWELFLFGGITLFFLIFIHD